MHAAKYHSILGSSWFSHNVYSVITQNCRGTKYIKGIILNDLFFTWHPLSLCRPKSLSTHLYCQYASYSALGCPCTS